MRDPALRRAWEATEAVKSGPIPKGGNAKVVQGMKVDGLSKSAQGIGTI